jgi:F420-dependent oxidoreductase-like protein
LSTVITPGQDVRASLDHALRLESAGVDVIGVTEAYGIDSVSMLGYLAAKTERAVLISHIMPIYSRTPALIAMTAAGLDEVSGSRFVLGLGASGPQVVEGWHGVPYDAPIARTREIMDVCRTVWRRDRLVHEGRHYQIPRPGGLGRPLKLITHLHRPEIPIYLAALGERNVALAAELADGWIPLVYVPERADAVWGAALARGRHKRAGDRGPLEISAGGPVRDHGRARSPA